MPASSTKVYILLCFCVFFKADILAQNLKKYFPETNGVVDAIAVKGDTTFIGGTFTHLFQPNNSGAYGVLFNDSNELISPNYDQPNGEVFSAVPDGNNGYYIAGKFTKVGDSTRTNLAHIDNKGKVTSKLNLKPDNAVYSMSRLNDKLYLGGQFTYFGDRKSTSGNPIKLKEGTINLNAPSINGDVYCAVSDAKGGWYIGGDFTLIGGIPRSKLAHIDFEGNLYNWAPVLNNAVYSLAFIGSTLYVGGTFDSVNNVLSPNFFEIDPINEQLINPKGTLRFNGAVSSITQIGSTLYIGGYFTNVSDSIRRRLVAIDIGSMKVTNWNPSVDDGYVTTIEACGSSIYIGGNFTRVNGVIRNFLAAIDCINGNKLKPWNPSANGRVNKITSFNSEIYIGGDFTIIGSTTRNHLAQLDTISSTPTIWNPDIDGRVLSISKQGPSLFIGGDFHHVGNRHRNYAAEISINEAYATAWEPNPNQIVYALTVSGKNIFVGGGFKQIGGKNRGSLASIDLQKDSLDDSWIADCDGIVKVISIDNLKGNVYVGGYFTTINSTLRNNLAVLDYMNADVGVFDPNMDDTVYSIDFNQNVIVVGGRFTRTNSVQRNNIAMYDIGNGLISSWKIDVNGPINTVKIVENKIIIGGNFARINNQSQPFIGMVDINNGQVENWLNSGANNIVRNIQYYNNRIYVCGDYTVIGNQNANRIAILDKASGVPLYWPVYSNGTINTIAVTGVNVYAGGSFTIAGGINHNFIAAIHSKWGTIFNWDPKLDASVKLIRLYGNVLYTTGLFSKIGTQNRKGLAAIDIASMNALPLSLAIKNGDVLELLVKDDNLFVCGSFDTINNQERKSFAQISIQTNTLLPWHHNFNGIAYTMDFYNDNIIIGGAFSIIDAATRSRIAMLNITNQNISNIWKPAITGTIVNAVRVKDTLVYIGGVFSRIGNIIRSNIGNIGLVSGLANTFTSNVTTQVKDLYLNNNTLWAIGNFNLVDNQIRTNIAAYNLTNGLLNDWTLLPNSQVHRMEVVGSMVYIGGEFTIAKGWPRNSFVVTDTAAKKCITPMVLSTTRPVNFCFGDSTTIQYSPLITNSYTWLNNFTEMKGIKGSAYTTKVSGKYSVQVLDSITGCTDTSSVIIVNANAIPVIQNIAFSDTIDLCNGDSVLLQVGYKPENKYNWYKNNTLLPIADSVFSIYVKDSGYYGLTVFTSTSCKNQMNGTYIRKRPIPVTSTISGFSLAPIGTTFNYKVDKHPGSHFNWTVVSGNVTSGIGSDSVNILWQSKNDSALITVTEVSKYGCVGNKQLLKVAVRDSVIIVKDTFIHFTAQGGDSKLVIISNLSWEIQNNQNWIIPQVTQGQLNDTVLLTVIPNPDNTSRLSKLQIYSGSVKVNVTILQDSTSDYLLLSKDTFAVVSDTSSLNLGIQCNSTWQTLNNFPWVTLSKTNGIGNTSIKVQMAKNTSLARNAVFLFSSGTINRYFVIKQSAYNGLNNVELKPTCSIYPNPSNGIYYLDQCDLLVNRIVLKDLTGKELRTFQMENNKFNKIEVDLPNGVYFMTLFSDNEVYNTKIILHR